MRRLTVAATVAATTLTPSAIADDPVLSVALSKKDGAPARCSYARVRGLDVLGGCELSVVEAPMRFDVVGVFGDQWLARCPLGFRMRIGARGALVLNYISTSQSSELVKGPCGDILACRRNLKGPEEDKLPWTGRMTAARNGSLRADIGVCFDTCLGRFEGRTRFSVERRPRGTLRLYADRRTPVGMSGLEVAGSWTVRSAIGGRLLVTAP